MSKLALLAVVALSVLACSSDDQGGNGTDCLKNDDCESGYCSSNKCRPKPSFGGATGGSSGSGGAAGAGGS
ncbi:MAG: hypothetical protein IT374_15720 [Polyangiaceae bacterium]|nr:hypothetical protein [Polyangiaceae bacterium]